MEESGVQAVMISGSSAVMMSLASREGFGAGLALSGHGSTSASPVSLVGCRFPPYHSVCGVGVEPQQDMHPPAPGTSPASDGK